MLSYFIISDPKIYSTLNVVQDKNLKPNKKIELFIDSGAFSAFTQGIEIDIQDYINFIKRHKKYFEVYANLDVIGDARKTLKNQEIMEEAGLAPLPCFHYGESIRHLKYYIKKYDYIAIGGMVPIHNKELTPWLDNVFLNYICDSNGMPKVKVHGFGMTSFSLIPRYPWFSTDSTTWVITGRMGAIYIPKFKKGKWIYDKPPWKINVSTRSPSKDEMGEHISTLSPNVKKIVFDYIHSKGYKLGKSEFRFEQSNYQPKENERWFGKVDKDGKREVEKINKPGISNMYILRDEMNILYFLNLEKAIPEWPWALKIKKKGFNIK